ncbi:hypothetical protein [Acuticoccus kandeliae]|uniref:hypothetical protein n=1 Tax=Acuticoccus kandeliae TaxID=2073160 RepID=UPI000D3E43DB|nr:hypothetical protein [Acuticoccus kandeliae]
MFDLHVDSVVGSDAASGAVGAPLQTLAAAETAALALGGAVRIGLAAGSEWRESLELASLAGVTIAAYGDIAAEGLPMIRGDDPITGGWETSADRSDAHASVYSVEWTHDIATGQAVGGPSVWEDGALLTWRDTVADVEANPGSFTHDGADSADSPVTLYVHPAGSTDPRADGKTYEATRRNRVVTVGDGATVRQLWCRRVGHDDGAINGGTGCLVDRCLLDGNIVHDALLASGEYRGTIAWRDFSDPRNDAIALEFYAADGTGLSGLWRGCVVKAPVLASGVQDVTALGGHTNGTDFYDLWEMVDCAIEGGKIGGNDVVEAVATRLSLVDAAYALKVEGTGKAQTLTDLQLIHEAAAAGRFVEVNGAVAIDGMRAHVSGAWTNQIVYQNDANPLVVTGSVFVDAGGTAFRRCLYHTGGDTSVTGCVFENASGVSQFRAVEAEGGFLAADDNVYHPATWQHCAIEVGGVLYGDAATWFAAARPAQEANSVQADPEIADPENGDFSLEAAGLPATCGLARPAILYTTVPASLAAAELRLRA